MHIFVKFQIRLVTIVDSHNWVNFQFTGNVNSNKIG